MNIEEIIDRVNETWKRMREALSVLLASSHFYALPGSSSDIPASWGPLSKWEEVNRTSGIPGLAA